MAATVQSRAVTFLFTAGLAALLMVSAAGAHHSATKQFVVVGDRIVGGVRMGVTLGRARAVLGAPDTMRRLSKYECRAAWRTRDLSLLFLDLSNAAPCVQGGLIRATASSAKWRTARGLRVGDPVARLRKLYHAATHPSTSYSPYRGWWLITRHACSTVGGQAYPGLLARTARGRVSAFVLGVAPCE